MKNKFWTTKEVAQEAGCDEKDIYNLRQSNAHKGKFVQGLHYRVLSLQEIQQYKKDGMLSKSVKNRAIVWTQEGLTLIKHLRETFGKKKLITDEQKEECLTKVGKLSEQSDNINLELVKAVTQLVENNTRLVENNTVVVRTNNALVEALRKSRSDNQNLSVTTVLPQLEFLA